MAEVCPVSTSEVRLQKAIWLLLGRYFRALVLVSPGYTKGTRVCLAGKPIKYSTDNKDQSSDMGGNECSLTAAPGFESSQLRPCRAEMNYHTDACDLDIL